MGKRIDQAFNLQQCYLEHDFQSHNRKKHYFTFLIITSLDIFPYEV
jgi:hypothetical protein